MISSAFRLLALVAVLAIVAIDAKKKCKLSEMDDCSSRLLMLGDPTFTFPLTIPAMNERCKDIKRLENCVKSNAKGCMKDGAQQAISVLTYSVARTNKNFCSSNKRKRAFIEIGKCANPHLAELNGYMDELNRNFHGVKNIKESKTRIPIVCCNFYRFKHQVVDLFNNKCPQNAQEAENLIDGYTQDVLNLACGDYSEDNDKCDSLLKTAPKYTKPLRYKSIILSVVQSLNALE